MARKKLVEQQFVPQFVYGGIDGAITTLAVMAGAYGASLSSAVILILGFANLVADGFSMGVSSYLSVKSEKDAHRTHKDASQYARKAKTALKQGTITFLSFVFVGFIPLAPFVFAHFIPALTPYRFILSVLATALALALVGWVKGTVVKKKPFSSAVETLVIGGIAALLAFTVGYLLRGIGG